MNIRKIEKHNLFALDAVGALMSTCYLSLIFYFDKYFGMPKDVVIVFIGIAITYTLYSSIMYLIKPTNWPRYLSIIALLNYAYCLYTFYHVISNIERLSLLGLAYFVGEILVIIALATYEFQVSKKAQNLD